MTKGLSTGGQSGRLGDSYYVDRHPAWDLTASGILEKETSARLDDSIAICLIGWGGTYTLMGNEVTVTSFGYTGGNGIGSLVAVLTPVIGPVQVSGTVTFPGVGSAKKTVRLPRIVVASGIVKLYGTVELPVQNPWVETVIDPCPLPLPDSLLAEIWKVKVPLARSVEL